MAFIEVNHVSKTYKTEGKAFTALHDVSLSVDKGEFICLLGPSGCGKTTLLNALAGFEQVDSGSVVIDDKPVTKPSSEYVTIFQNYGLLPWQTVEKNVMLGLWAKGVPEAEARKTAHTYLDMVGLSAFKNYRPAQLSGGMQQRVSIARALAVEPKILFMDEPFGALDAITRMKMQDDLHDLAERQHITIIFVTHDIEEAIILADRVVIMTPNPGHIKEIVPITLGTHRNRTATDFLAIRDKIFNIFEMKPEENLEYYL